MATPTGINNGNSYYMRSLRRIYVPAPSLVTIEVPLMVTVRELAEKAYQEQQTGLLLVNGGGYLAVKGGLMVTEAERKMTLLAEYADELAEVLQ